MLEDLEKTWTAIVVSGQKHGQPVFCRKCYFVLVDELEGFLESGNLEIAETEWIACRGLMGETIRAMMR